MTDITTLSAPADWEVVDFALTDVTKAYVAIRNGRTDEHRLYKSVPPADLLASYPLQLPWN